MHPVIAARRIRAPEGGGCSASLVIGEKTVLYFQVVPVIVVSEEEVVRDLVVEGDTAVKHDIVVSLKDVPWDVLVRVGSLDHIGVDGNAVLEVDVVRSAGRRGIIAVNSEEAIGLACICPISSCDYPSKDDV